jgi:hypothetical protein
MGGVSERLFGCVQVTFNCAEQAQILKVLSTQDNNVVW